MFKRYAGKISLVSFTDFILKYHLQHHEIFYMQRPVYSEFALQIAMG